MALVGVGGLVRRAGRQRERPLVRRILEGGQRVLIEETGRWCGYGKQRRTACWYAYFFEERNQFKATILCNIQRYTRLTCYTAGQFYNNIIIIFDTVVRQK